MKLSIIGDASQKVGEGIKEFSKKTWKKIKEVDRNRKTIYDKGGTVF